MTDFYARQHGARVMIANLLRDAVPASPAQLPPGALVKIAGVAAPGPGGPLRAPLSGTPCVWWQTVRADERVNLLLSGTPTGVAVGGRLPQLPSSMFATDFPLPGGDSAVRASVEPFALVADGAAMGVSPQGTWMDSTVQSTNVFDRSETRIYQVGGVALAEWVVPAGVPLFAMGVVAPGPFLAPPTGAAAVVTTRPEAQLARDIQAFLASGRSPEDVQRRIRFLVIAIVMFALVVAGVFTAVLVTR